MNGNAIVNNLIKKTLLAFFMIMLTGAFCVGIVYSDSQTKSSDTRTPKLEKNKNEVEVLYYDKASDIKIINKNNFLLKIEKNEKGLKIVHELGTYPDAYPVNLPAPRTHID